MIKMSSSTSDNQMIQRRLNREARESAKGSSWSSGGSWQQGSGDSVSFFPGPNIAECRPLRYDSRGNHISQGADDYCGFACGCFQAPNVQQHIKEKRLHQLLVRRGDIDSECIANGNLFSECLNLNMPWEKAVVVAKVLMHVQDALGIQREGALQYAKRQDPHKFRYWQHKLKSRKQHAMQGRARSADNSPARSDYGSDDDHGADSRDSHRRQSLQGLEQALISDMDHFLSTLSRPTAPPAPAMTSPRAAAPSATTLISPPAAVPAAVPPVSTLTSPRAAADPPGDANSRPRVDGAQSGNPAEKKKKRQVSTEISARTLQFGDVGISIATSSTGPMVVDISGGDSSSAAADSRAPSSLPAWPPTPAPTTLAPPGGDQA